MRHAMLSLSWPGVAMLTAVTSSAMASVTFRLAVDQSQYSVARGGSVDVAIRLVEERQSAEEASVILASDGLIGFDLAVTRQSGTAVITDASPSTGQFNLLFLSGQSPDPLPAAGGATVELFVSALDNPGPVGVQDGLLRVMDLGTVTITMPADAPQMSTFTVADSIILGSNTVTNLGTALDSQIAATSFTVVVPEPTCLTQIAAGLAAIARRPRRARAR